MTDYEFYSLMNRLYLSCKMYEGKAYARAPFASPSEVMRFIEAVRERLPRQDNFPPIPQEGHISSRAHGYWYDFDKYYR